MKKEDVVCCKCKGKLAYLWEQVQKNFSTHLVGYCPKHKTVYLSKDILRQLEDPIPSHAPGEVSVKKDHGKYVVSINSKFDYETLF